jgi:hypothetical protein
MAASRKDSNMNKRKLGKSNLEVLHDIQDAASRIVDGALYP